MTKSHSLFTKLVIVVCVAMFTLLASPRSAAMGAMVSSAMASEVASHETTTDGPPCPSGEIFALGPIALLIIGTIAGGLITWVVAWYYSPGVDCNALYNDNMNTLNAHRNDISPSTYTSAANTLTNMWVCCLQGKSWNTATGNCQSSS